MRKTRIEIRTNIAACADAHKGARRAVDDWRNNTTDMTHSKGEAEICFIDMK